MILTPTHQVIAGLAEVEHTHTSRRGEPSDRQQASRRVGRARPRTRGAALPLEAATPAGTPTNQYAAGMEHEHNQTSFIEAYRPLHFRCRAEHHSIYISLQKLLRKKIYEHTTVMYFLYRRRQHFSGRWNGDVHFGNQYVVRLWAWIRPFIPNGTNVRHTVSFVTETV